MLVKKRIINLDFHKKVIKFEMFFFFQIVIDALFIIIFTEQFFFLITRPVFKFIYT